jgi:uroporphyrinogen decarboxylase
LRGLERLIFDTVDDPGFVHELMEFTTALLKVWVAKVRETGVGVGMGEASASCSVISPRIYKAFIKPYHQEIIEYFKERKLHVGLHICGYSDPIMENVLETGIGMISIDSPSSLGKLVELARDRVVIMGNVPTALFAEGTKQQMEAAVKECVETAAKGSKYVLCSGCEIPLNSNKESVDWFMEAANKYGRYN